MNRACVVIPTYNHYAALDAILSELCARKLPVIVVDDGSLPETGERIREICARHEDVEYRRQTPNGGKGAAVLHGLQRVGARGFTHAVQIDADGQHDLSSLDALLAAAERNPHALVTGLPQYDESMPASRRIWRPFTNFWVRVNTLSMGVPDAMCGFRVYPVAATLRLIARSVHGRRMDFDVEIIAKACWAGMTIVPVSVRVRYPEENFSNFDVLWDNVRLSALQTRMFLGMLIRSPWLLLRKLPLFRRNTAQPTQWSAMRERGSYLGMRILLALYSVFGRTICLCVMAPVVFYFFLTGAEQRRASRDYLEHLWQSGKLKQRPNWWLSFRHFLAFGESALDKIAAWSGDIPRARLNGIDSDLMDGVARNGQGAIILTAHLGNTEVIRALATLGERKIVNVLMHTEHAKLFRRLMHTYSAASPVRAIGVTTIGADTAILLSEAVSRGEWVVIAADRVPVSNDNRTVDVPFLGGIAPFPQGPFILGAILKVPAYLLFCVRDGSGFDVHFSKFADRIELPRRDRLGAIRHYAAQFARALETRVAETPLQWFNFYSFWRAPRETGPELSPIKRAAE